MAVSSAPTAGLITDEAVVEARKMIGLQLRPRGRQREATPERIAESQQGDWRSQTPLFRDHTHGRKSRYGSTESPPMFADGVRLGSAGPDGGCLASTASTHGNDWELYRTSSGRLVSAVEGSSGSRKEAEPFRASRAAVPEASN